MALDKVGFREFKITVTDENIVKAVNSWYPKHADAPTEVELADLRVTVCRLCRISDECGPIISLHWLRNEFVRLRKCGLAKTKQKTQPVNTSPKLFS